MTALADINSSPIAICTARAEPIDQLLLIQLPRHARLSIFARRALAVMFIDWRPG